MSELFTSYEKDFIKNIQAANKKLSAPDRHDSMLKLARQDCTEAEHWLILMEKEYMNISPEIGKQFQGKLKRHKENLVTLKKNLLNEETRKSARELLNSSEGDPRAPLLSGNETLQKSGETLERALKVGNETERLGTDTLNTLKGQRRQIQGINEKVNDVGSNLKQATRVVTVMDRRRLTMKFVMMGIIVMLTIAVLLVLYVRIT
jgi:myosin heavy subunit